ncbi:MAG: T9SS type A sorting domain-containing protein [Bacteroidota bacterium]
MTRTHHFVQRFLFSLFLLFLSNSCLLGQLEFSPAGAEWCYQLLPLENENPGYLHLTYARDTTLETGTYKILEGEGFRHHLDNSRHEYDIEFWLFQRNDSIFYYGGTGLIEDFLFKLNYEVGEITTSLLFNARFEVLEKEEVRFEDLTVQKHSMALLLNGNVPTDIYDRFGPNRGFIEGWWTNVIPGDNYRLFQYKDDQIPTVNLADGKSCLAFFKTEVEEKPAVPEIVESCPTLLYPNPTYQELSVAFSSPKADLNGLQLRVFNNIGQLMELPVTKQESGFEVDTKSLPSGIYQLQITGSCEKFVRSFVKIYD